MSFHKKVEHNYTWVDYLSAILGTTGVILGTIALTKEPSESDRDFQVEGDLQVDNDANINNNLTVGNVAKADSKLLKEKPKGLHVHGELDINNSSFRINNSAITTNLHYLSSYDLQARDIHATRDLQIDGKFVYLDVLEANNGLEVVGDLIVNDSDFAIYRNFGSGYVGLTIPIQSNSSILASNFRATSDIIVDGDLSVTGSFDYKSTLVASGGLDVTGTFDMNSGDLVINETKLTTSIPIESTSDVLCNIFDVNSSSFRVDSKISTSLDFETSANVDITGTLDVADKASFDSNIVMTGSNFIMFDEATVTGFNRSSGGRVNFWSNITPIAQFDSDGIRVNSGSFRAPGGSAAEPGFEFFPENGTGFFSPSSGDISISCNSTTVLELTATDADFQIPVRFPYGTASLPSLAFSSDPDTGLFGNFETVYVTCGGSTVGTFKPGSTSFSNNLYASSIGFSTDETSGLSTPSYGEMDLKANGVVVAHLTSTSIDWKASGSLVAQLTSTGTDWKVPLFLPDGTQAAPSHSFESSPTTGMFLDSGDIVLSRGNSEVGRFRSEGIVLPKGGSTFNGGGLVFSGDPDTGIYSVNDNEVIFLAGGERPLRYNDTRLLTDLPLYIPTGDVMAPSFAFDDQQSCGFFYPQLSTVGVTCDGNSVFYFGDELNESFVPIVAPSGTVALPSIYFTGDSNTGFYSSAADEIAVTCNGFQTARFSENDVFINSRLSVSSGGSSTNLALVIQGDTNTGIYSPGADQLALVTNGAEVLVAKASSLEVNQPIYSASGSNLLPSYSFLGDVDTGVYLPAADTLGFSTNGVEVFRLTEDLTTVNNNLVVVDGTELELSIRFAGDTDTGFYRKNLGQIAYVGGGTERFSVGSSLFTSSVTFQTIDGTVGAPSYSFVNSTGTGMYLPTTNTLGFSANGVEALRLTEDYTTVQNSLVVPNGTMAQPSIRFAGDLDTGFYRRGVDQFAFVSNNVDRIAVGSGLFSSFVPIRTVDGSQNTPSYSFTSGVGCGMWSPGSGIVCFSSGANERFRIDTSVASFSDCSLRFIDGSVTSPSFGFVNNIDTGFYKTASGFSVTVDSTQVVEYTSTGVDFKVPVTSNFGIAQKMTRIDEPTVELDSSHTHVQLTADTPHTVTLPSSLSSSVLNGHIISVRNRNDVSHSTIQAHGMDKINGSTSSISIRSGGVLYFCLDKADANWTVLSEYRNPKLDFIRITTSTLSPSLPMKKYYFGAANENIAIQLPEITDEFTGDEFTVVAQSSYSVTLHASGNDNLNGENIIPPGESRKVFLLGSQHGWSIF